MDDQIIGTETEITALRREIEQLNRHRFIRLHNSLPKLIAFNLLRGLAFGLGTVLGATILVWILGQFLANIDFIPIIGDWAAQINEQINAQ